MKIKWIGKFDGNLPTAELPSTASPLGIATSKSALFAVPLLAIAVLFLLVKINTMGVRIDRTSFFIGIGIALIFTAAHELLHAVCFPSGHEVIMYYTSMGLGITSIAPLSKKRFLLINLLPMVKLGIVPLIVWLFLPKDCVVVNSILFAFSFFHLGASYGDLQNITNAIRNVPKNATIQISGDQIYWYEQ